MSKGKDLTGVKKGKLTAISSTGTKSSNGDFLNQIQLLNIMGAGYPESYTTYSFKEVC